MNIKRVSIAEADGHLAELIAAVKRGEDVVIEDDEHTQVKLVKLPQSNKPRVLGLHAGLVDVGDDFNAPLPDSFWFGERS